MLGRCCICERKVRLINLKGFNSSTGATLWEYGLAGMYALHYGIDRISAVTHDDTITTPTKYGIWAGEGYFFQTSARTGGSLPALYDETLSLVTINGVTGAETSRSLLSDWYTEVPGSGGNSVTTMNVRLYQGTIGDPQVAGLSGGNVAFLGHIEPSVIWSDRTNNTATKTYRLCPHTQSEGKVYFLTKTSSQTITVNYNDTAASIQAAFAAVGDVVSATATGGPWPLMAVSLTVTWSAATGDIQGLKRDSYATVGTSPNTAQRKTQSLAFTASPSTGLVLNTLGYRLGAGNTTAISDLMPVEFPSSHIVVKPPTDGAASPTPYIVAGDSNRVGILGANTLECWDASPTGVNAWNRSWALWLNVTPVGGLGYKATALQCQDATFSISVPRAGYYGGTYSGATIPTSAPTPSHWDNDDISTSTTQGINLAAHVARDGDTAYRWCATPRRLSTGQTFYFQGIEHSDDTTRLQLSGALFGVSSTKLFGISSGSDIVGGSTPESAGTTNVLTSGTLSGTIATFKRIVFYWPGRWLKPDTEFRFTFFPSASVPISTAWMSWPGSAAGMETAIIDLFGENTEGVRSNVVVWPFGSPPSLDNADFSELQQNLDILFSVSPRNNNPFGFIPADAINTKTQIELRNIETMNQGDLTSWSATDGAVQWSRFFGYATHPFTEVDYPVRPAKAWYRGSYVWAAGGPVNPE